jgi:hypothetical protein
LRALTAALEVDVLERAALLPIYKRARVARLASKV